MHSYSGSASGVNLGATASITVVDDTDPSAAATYNTPTQGLADLVEAIRQRLQGVSDFGDGSDGAATFDGSATVSGWSRSGSTYTATQHTYFTDATISAGVTLKPSGFGMWVNGTLTLTGSATIDYSGADASGQTAGAALSSGIWRGGAGGTGGNSGAGGSNSSLSNAVGGAGGVGGGSSSGQSGGTVTCTAPLPEDGAIRAPTSFAGGMLFGSSGMIVPKGGCGGSGGAGGAAGTVGGGGGAGGGVILLMARDVSCSTTCNIRAKGGIGGNGTVSGGSSGGGGGGGGGGGVLFGYNRSTGAASPSARVSVTGGAGGTGYAAGATGSDGLALVRVV